ncbi:MAG: FAD-binding oxidoreductase [Ignavibacteriaceae bacterium]|nr:FAD-binding oxidoreductase [Ignavibacteriaceae bacterium]
MILKREKDEFTPYLSDASNFTGNCSELYILEHFTEIPGILAYAARKHKHVTVCGNRTGLTGSAIPESGIVVSTEKLNRIINIDPDQMTAVVEPGVILSDFIGVIESLGLYYPPDPTEGSAFIGGTVATNASGAKSFKYGSTRKFVLALDVVLPDGDTITINRGEIFAGENGFTFRTGSGRLISIPFTRFSFPSVKNAAGYYYHPGSDLIDLFIGSEGTLGIITRIKLKLLKKPASLFSCFTFFDDTARAFDFMDETRALSRGEGLTDFRAIEYFDAKSLSLLAERHPNLPSGKAAGVWFEQETKTDDDPVLQEIYSLLEKHEADLDKTWASGDVNEIRKISSIRHEVSYAVNEYIASKGLRKLGTDTAVPPENFREFYQFSKDMIEKSGLQYVIYGHFGDCHMHLNMLPKNTMEFNEGRNYYARICMKAVQLGGTVSAEHGIGKIKREIFKLMYDETHILDMARIKKTLDPHCLLGVNNIFDHSWLAMINP